MKECEKLKTRKVIMKTASQVAKSPMLEKTNVFVGGMSKTLMSQHEESIENGSCQTAKADTSSSLVKGQKSERSGRINVINFNVNRQKAPGLTLSNITNFE